MNDRSKGRTRHLLVAGNLRASPGTSPLPRHVLCSRWQSIRSMLLALCLVSTTSVAVAAPAGTEVRSAPAGERSPAGSVASPSTCSPSDACQLAKDGEPGPSSTQQSVAPARTNAAVIPVPQKGMEERHAEKVAMARAHKYDLLMIGDSIMHGLERASVKPVWDTYFGARNALNLGYGGARTENILWNLANGELDNQSPKVVTLLIGTNNADDANYPTVNSAEEIAEGTAAIVDLLKTKLPQTKILVLRIFPRSNRYERPDGSERGSVAKRAATNARAGELVARLADGKRVIFLDVNAVFLKPDGAIDPEMMPDLLHPSPAGAMAWAKAMEPEIARLFGDAPRE